MPIGNIEPYNPTKEQFPSWIGRSNGFLSANKIGVQNNNGAAARRAADKEKMDTLIAIIGPAGYSVLENQCKPDDPGTKDFDTLVEHLKKNIMFKPKSK